MKKYINYTVMLIALLAMGFTFTSCEDDNNNGSGDTVKPEWDLVSRLLCI